MASVEVFVDESCQKGYVLCAAVVATGDLAAARRAMRALKPKNRDRLHMHAESRNREQIISEFIRLGIISEAHLFISPIRGRKQRLVRDACLRELAVESAEMGATRILVESCSQNKQDHAALTGALAGVGALDRVSVAIDTPTSHELLWAADLVAWAYCAGGRARQMVMGIVKIHEVA